MSPNAALLEFAADFSGGSARLVKLAKRVLASPPKRTPEALGYYPFGDETDFELALRRVVSTLTDDGFLIGVEDKYVTELFPILEKRGAFRSRDLTAQSRGTLLRGRPTKGLRSIRAHFPKAVAEVEELIRANGQELMMVEVPLGDTLHFALLEQSLADRWRNVRLYEPKKTSRDCTFAVRPAQWRAYWTFFTYAAGLEGLAARMPAGFPSPAPLRDL
jgi:hypothetical protein